MSASSQERRADQYLVLELLSGLGDDAERRGEYRTARGWRFVVDRVEDLIGLEPASVPHTSAHFAATNAVRTALLNAGPGGLPSGVLREECNSILLAADPGTEPMTVSQIARILDRMRRRRLGGQPAPEVERLSRGWHRATAGMRVPRSEASPD